jgi:hypothetical protein
LKVSKEPQAQSKIPMCEAPISADTSSSTIFRLRHLQAYRARICSSLRIICVLFGYGK